jgi:hypothetical protein
MNILVSMADKPQTSRGSLHSLLLAFPQLTSPNQRLDAVPQSVSPVPGVSEVVAKDRPSATSEQASNGIAPLRITFTVTSVAYHTPV